MHRTYTPTEGDGIPGQWVEQDPAPLVLLTAADTDIQMVAAARSMLPPAFAAVRVAHLLHLQHPFAIDDYGERVLARAQGILVRLLGGRSYWAYGLERVQEIARSQGIPLVVLPGDDRPDWELLQHSTLALAPVHQLWRYWLEGGVDNIAQGLRYWSDLALGSQWGAAPVQTWPHVGLYRQRQTTPTSGIPRVGILLYRAHVLAGNVAPIDALCSALERRGLDPVCVYTYGIRDPDLAPFLQEVWANQDEPVRLAINTTSFALGEGSSLWDALGIPVLQAILSGGSLAQWQGSLQGLGCRDLAMNVALPEVDGHVVTRAIAVKGVQRWDPDLQADIVGYQPLSERIEWLADLAQNWVRLASTPASERRVALILANYPCRDGRLANGVGLDTPASCLQILQALQQAGYHLGDGIPATSQALIQQLTHGITNDPMGGQCRPVYQHLDPQVYQQFWQHLPTTVQSDLKQRWGDPPTQPIPIAGIQRGHLFIGIQPPRGYDQDPSLNYHAPDLEPPHEYLAFYVWIRQVWGAQALVHVGKHGNLEWLPGKSLALSDTCYPDIALGPLPHFYPFIVNDPGEGSQAKRRAQAVILDHLTPPLTRAGLYGPLAELESLLDEHSQAQGLDPRRLPVIEARIRELIEQEHFQMDPLSRKTDPGDPWGQTLAALDGYLCELKESQIRDGLHILGQLPDRPQLIHLLAALARYPGGSQRGLTQAIAQDWGWTWDPLQVDLTDPVET